MQIAMVYLWLCLSARLHYWPNKEETFVSLWDQFRLVIWTRSCLHTELATSVDKSRAVGVFNGALGISGQSRCCRDGGDTVAYVCAVVESGLRKSAYNGWQRSLHSVRCRREYIHQPSRKENGSVGRVRSLVFWASAWLYAWWHLGDMSYW